MLVYSSEISLAVQGAIHEYPLNFTPNQLDQIVSAVFLTILMCKSREDRESGLSQKSSDLDWSPLYKKAELIEYDAFPWLEHRLGGRLVKRVPSVGPSLGKEKKKELYWEEIELFDCSLRKGVQNNNYQMLISQPIYLNQRSFVDSFLSIALSNIPLKQVHY
ncbi:hypothetical protein pb186bvf_002606 [Paramecium bursaria]